MGKIIIHSRVNIICIPAVNLLWYNLSNLIRAMHWRVLVICRGLFSLINQNAIYSIDDRMGFPGREESKGFPLNLEKHVFSGINGDIFGFPCISPGRFQDLREWAGDFELMIGYDMSRMCELPVRRSDSISSSVQPKMVIGRPSVVFFSINADNADMESFEGREG
jgi:hypothetical protein